ncbi:hemocyte protein-glutamine gamma-glutamyltransferase-like isoform X3 [Lingula anatina]|uniref:protein-glutamine gamma-glutamyltransferase n=1 Tax=Lingula anatina TaxID=7574 RepID=A0A1S3H8X2_LINAN|nr:hemocyte protein-glutamine gamma-glutamyltransferase-like isoform X3 [Lingula anatina]|eukprot:XP_013382452.1 hemocyte protein-glutamine gamma-glutamyltransferase-like isoform X3 [Lingula anatina]
MQRFRPWLYNSGDYSMSRRGFSRGRRMVTYESRMGSAFDPVSIPHFWQAYGSTADGRSVDRWKAQHERSSVKIDDNTVMRCNWVDLKIAQNSKDHHTDQFECSTYWEDDKYQRQDPYLILRRGQAFVVDLQMDKPFNKEMHDLKLCFEYGKFPKPGKGTSVSFHVSAKDRPKEWGAEIVSVVGNTITVSIITPPDCLIGKWDMRVDTAVKLNDGSTRLFRYFFPKQFYVLFNPWCKDDQVYMPDTKLLNEYVLNDVGKIYAGTSKQIGSKPWNFGQFEDFVLDCSLLVLEKSGLALSARGNPVQIARKISAFTNSPDDNGILMGNWSGNYEGGTRPTKWVGSVAILQEYWKRKRPVKYGQCWVFSGVVTTICRCLGIPCRPVTNFVSAHDSDGTISIDDYFDMDGNLLEEFCEDSIWNFHVWNDVWMARPDLPSGCGGWQAIDATPQELSDGVYCAGPCSLNAIKAGQVYLPYDGPFIFAEVNADRVRHRRRNDGTWDRYFMKASVGQKISTKKPLVTAVDSFSRWKKEDPDREDITEQYKFKEGTSEERAATLAANLKSTRRDLYDRNTDGDDVKFEWEDKDFITVGSSFDVALVMTNKAKEERKVEITLKAAVVYYTGVIKSFVKGDKFEITLAAGEKGKKVTMSVTPDDYLDELVDHANFKTTVIAKVDETNQIFMEDDDFMLRPPPLEFEFLGKKNEIKTLTPFKLKVGFTNPLPIPLTRCMFIVEGPGLQKPMEYQLMDVGPGKRAEQTISLTPKTAGNKQVIVSFDCYQPCDVTGMFPVTVKG